MAMTAGSGGGADLGRLMLRLALGGMMLLHGFEKILSGPAGIIDVVERAGLPGPVAYLVYVGEIVAPLMIIAGWWTRPAALVIAVNMAFGVALVHRSDIFALASNGGWKLELQGMYFFTAIAIALLGAGKFSIGGARGRFN
jgi:putative oxidoreductase